VELLVGDVLRSAAARHPDRVAAGIGDDSLTFAELESEARACAARLLAAGVAHGDRVGWVARNSLEGAVLHAACALLGAVFSPYTPAATAAELAVLVEIARPTVVLSLDGRPGTRTYVSLPAATAHDGALPPVHEDDPFVVYFTSGTTGRPKGAVLSHRAERLRGGFDHVPQGPHVSMFPQFHMAGWVSHLESWNRGDTVVWVDRPEPEQLFAAIDRHRAHSTYLIPAVWRRVLDADRRGYDLSSLRVADTGTSAASPELLGGIEEAFPTTATSVVYGSTEAHRVLVLEDRDLFRKPFSVGQPVIGAFVRRDDAGELWVRSPLLFSGYLDDPAATDAALVDGWYRTGDVVERDDEGYHFVVGRTKELIRSGGDTVAPAEVEAALLCCTGVHDVAVAGLPDADWGEVVTAFVVPAAGHTVTLEQLHRELGDRLSRPKLPRRLEIVDTIPRTDATGQVGRARLVARAQERAAGGPTVSTDRRPGPASPPTVCGPSAGPLDSGP
jgi:acyl-CoA synthetase (AMP-forming)/AMP-acid ligase II